MSCSLITQLHNKLITCLLEISTKKCAVDGIFEIDFPISNLKFIFLEQTVNILILNPNTSEAFTASIQTTADQLKGPETKVEAIRIHPAVPIPSIVLMTSYCVLSLLSKL